MFSIRLLSKVILFSVLGLGIYSYSDNKNTSVDVSKGKDYAEFKSLFPCSSAIGSIASIRNELAINTNVFSCKKRKNSSIQIPLLNSGKAVDLDTANDLSEILSLYETCKENSSSLLLQMVHIMKEQGWFVDRKKDVFLNEIKFENDIDLKATDFKRNDIACLTVKSECKKNYVRVFFYNGREKTSGCVNLELSRKLDPDTDEKCNEWFNIILETYTNPMKKYDQSEDRNSSTQMNSRGLNNKDSEQDGLLNPLKAIAILLTEKVKRDIFNRKALQKKGIYLQ